jgi:hypothetical protein
MNPFTRPHHSEARRFLPTRNPPVGFPSSPRIGDANASNASYTSIMNCTTPDYAGSGLNADLVMASVYGAIPSTDPKLLSSAARRTEPATRA